MINFLACHIPDMSTTTAPLRDLLKSDVHFHWNTQQEEALSKIKQILSTAPVLKYFDPSKASTIQADASKHGLGACLLQQGKPVAYASRSLTPTETAFWLSFSAVRNFTNLFTVSIQKSRQTTSLLKRFSLSHYAQFHQDCKGCCYEYKSMICLSNT